MIRLPDAVVAVHDTLTDANIAHAVGGAIALGYHAEPRATIEMDIDVFLPPRDAPRVVRVLEAHGAEVPEPAEITNHLPVAGLRCAWEGIPLDLFFAFDSDYFAIVESRLVRLPFADSTGTMHELPFISAEDLAVFKIRFDRPKDWVDLQAIVDAGPLDIDYVTHWVLYLGGEREWKRLRRFQAMARRSPPEHSG
jgi:hypothetical protein